MKLFIMRHGVAEEPGKDDQVPDFDRALTMRGRKRIRHIGRALRESWVLPDVIVASPVVRALQTAEIIAATLDPDEPVIVRRELAPEGDIITLVRELIASDIESALLVGHEPSLSEFVASVVGAENGPKSFSKGMIVAIRVAQEGGVKPLFMLDPKSLEQVPL